MIRSRLVQLGQMWPDGEPDNMSWIGMDANQARIQHGDGRVILGRECRSLAELEHIAAEIRENLDAALDQARRPLGPGAI